MPLKSRKRTIIQEEELQLRKEKPQSSRKKEQSMWKISSYHGNISNANKKCVKLRNRVKKFLSKYLTNCDVAQKEQ